MKDILKTIGLCTALYIAFLMGYKDRGDDGEVKYYLSKDVVFTPDACRDHNDNGHPYFVIIDEKMKIGVTSRTVSPSTCKDFFAMFERDTAQSLTAPGKGD